MSRVGIRERHIVDKGVATSDLAAEAARKALAERGIVASDLDAIIVATVTPDALSRPTACLVQHKIGAQKVWGFDLSAGCSQFVYALQVGAQFVQGGAHKKVMVIGADVMSSIIDYTDRATCVIFGDGRALSSWRRSTSLAEKETSALLIFYTKWTARVVFRYICLAAVA